MHLTEARLYRAPVVDTPGARVYTHPE